MEGIISTIYKEGEESTGEACGTGNKWTRRSGAHAAEHAFGL